MIQRVRHLGLNTAYLKVTCRYFYQGAAMIQPTRPNHPTHKAATHQALESNSNFEFNSINRFIFNGLQ